MTLASQVTVVRILLVPVLLFLIQNPTLSLFAAVLFAFMCATDWLDGYIARRFNQVSDLGKFLDPLADKLVVLLPLLWFVAWGEISPWLVSILIGRELVVTGLRLLSAGQKIVIAAGWDGKVKTVLQMTGIFLLILHLPLGNELLWVSAVVAVSSGWTIWKQTKVVFRAS